jgi:tetratricopeptide (TPR) repeat protein
LPLQAEGEFALVMEKLDAALALPGQPVKRGTMAHKHIIYMMLVEAAAQLPDPTALSEYAERLEELATQDSHKPYLAVAHRGWGIAHRLDGDYDLAKERLQQALALFVELEAGWQIGRTHVEMAELNLALTEEAKAADHFSQALGAFEKLKAGPDMARTQAALAEIA